ncbi:MarR family transcriptional regulator [Williamsia sp. Leaf354]|uniref:MarR family winged helix-turn-helix transcriptional regulator n=1 Tax=Williamsia sp. Leaf354 TaxID=1736349 RepID=UPI0007010455|nr:MarR family winged helix-turn-helix transcriptional regulator [Williamsia sp. Leaf354]KQR96492.1 MarR family transcriptional regulator [Williamsia sp. Leaf354]
MSASLPPAESPGLLLWRVTLAWQRAITAALRPLDLTHVQFVLLASTWWLTENESVPPTQRRIADHAGTDAMMTSQVLRALEARGLVERRPDPVDARARSVRPTPSGERLAREAVAVVEAIDHDFFAPVGSRDAVALLTRLAPDRSRSTPRES